MVKALNAILRTKNTNTSKTRISKAVKDYIIV